MKRYIYFVLTLLFISTVSCSKNEQTTDNSSTTNIIQQILYVNNGAEPEDLDPHITTGAPESYIQQSLFEGLVSKNPQTLEPIPAVAKSWTISDDLKQYTFNLRNDAVWSNGDPVTANDVVYSWNRVLMPSMASEYAYMLYVVKNAREYNTGEIPKFSEVGVKALDNNTLLVTLENPSPYFLQLLDHHSTFPVSQKTIEKHGEIDDHGTNWTRPGNLVGNGPFMLKEWIPNKVVIVEKNPLYWDAHNVKLEEVHYYPVPNKQTEERMFRTGQIHMTLDGQIITDKIEVYQKEQPDHIRITPYLGVYYYLFNTTRPPFDDVRIRKALSMAIDREAITQNVVKGGRIPAEYYTPPNTAGYYADAHTSYNPDEAKRLLADAGYPNGEGFPIVDLLFNTHINHQKVATAIQQMWKSILNINVTLSNQEWKVYLSSRLNLDYDIARAAWLADYADPNNFLDMYMTGSGNNHTGWTDPEYDRLLAEANRTSDSNQRFELFKQAEKILMDAAPIAPIYHEASVNLVHPSVKGIYRNKMTYYPFKYAYIEN